MPTTFTSAPSAGPLADERHLHRGEVDDIRDPPLREETLELVEIRDVAVDELQALSTDGLEGDVEAVLRAAEVETDDLCPAVDERSRRPRADRTQHPGDEIAPAGLAHDGFSDRRPP